MSSWDAAWARVTEGERRSVRDDWLVTVQHAVCEADRRDAAAAERDRAARLRDEAALQRDRLADEHALAGTFHDAAEDRRAAARDRQAAFADRHWAAVDRDAAAGDRALLYEAVLLLVGCAVDPRARRLPSVGGKPDRSIADE